MRRSLVAAFALLVLALLPLSASAASSRQVQSFTLTFDISIVTGTCPTAIFTGYSNPVATASGVVNDVATEASGGTGMLDLTLGGRFPDQVVGEFAFEGEHAVAEIALTGVRGCAGPQTFVITGLVWTGIMTDTDTGQSYAVNGAGRGNSFVAAIGPGGISLTLTGTARLTTTAAFR